MLNNLLLLFSFRIYFEHIYALLQSCTYFCDYIYLTYMKEYNFVSEFVSDFSDIPTGIKLQ